ncbi:MAG: DUF4389 domain-containing protein [Acidimicrobiales bacterium]
MSYPVEVELDAPTEVANWRPLVHWLLAIPHLLVSSALSSLGGVLALISWVVIVFTGSLPEGIANLQCLIIRYQVRTYSYVLWLREPYPAFDFTMSGADPGGDPVRVDIDARLEDRDRLTVGLRFLWIIPIAIFAWFVYLAAFVVVVVGFFAVLFTGSWPEGLRRFLVGAIRLGTRVSAYGYVLVDDYPPFALD